MVGHNSRKCLIILKCQPSEYRKCIIRTCLFILCNIIGAKKLLLSDFKFFLFFILKTVYIISIQWKSQFLPPFFSPPILPSLPPSSSLLLDYVIVKDRTRVQFEQLVPDGELSASIFKAAIMIGRWAFSLPKLLDLRGEVSVDDVVITVLFVLSQVPGT